MKKRIPLIILSVLFVALLIGAWVVNATEPEPATSIAGHTLSLDDNIRMIYYVDQTVPSGAEAGVLCWLAPQQAYTFGEEQFRLEQNGTQTVGGKVYAKYIFSNLAAKMMTVDVYAVSYVKVGDEVTYSSLDKYSILQYCYNKKGSTSTLSGGTATLGEMVTEILNYGTVAQKYFNYRTDRLANATYYEIKVENGVLEDNTTYGLYKLNDIATLTASATLNNQPFSHWENGAGETVGVECVLNLLATESGTWTAVYGDAVPEPQPDPTYSQGLAYVSNGNGTCYVSGIGLCTDTDLVIPPTSPAGDAVTRIGDNAFKDNTSITSVVIPEGVTELWNDVFSGCTSLTSVTIPGSVTRIINSVFNNTAITSVYITDLDKWCNIDFRGSGICNPLYNGADLYLNNELVTDLVVPETVTVIENNAFCGCRSLQSVSFAGIPQVLSINRDAFHGCTSLTSVTIPDSVMSIGDSAFRDCTSLTSITIPDSVTSIEWGAFGGCTSLTSVTIPDSVTSIGIIAFSDCSALTSITIPDSVTSIGNGAFSHCTSLTSVYITDITKWYAISFGDDFANPLYYARNLYLNGELVTDLVIPDSVTSVGDYAFFGCSSLKSVVIPDSVTSIGSDAFHDCTALTSVTMLGSVTSIGNGVFYNCTALTSITIPDSVTSIGYFTFSDCTSLTSITIPDSVTSIERYVFSGCTALASVTIPDSVTSIGERAFQDCTSLTSIIYQGTIAEWNAISKVSDWNNCTGKYTIYCTDGNISK